jgi:hypothetical protein
MKIIYTSKNQKILVDDEDFEYLNQFNWYICIGGYAAVKNTKMSTRLHRLVMDAKKGEFIDHINGDRLDNRKSNLRTVNKRQNNINAKQKRGKYKGVSFHKKAGKWVASITVNYKSIHLGLHDTEERAAMEYNTYAYIYQGEFAHLNKVKVNS